MSKPLPGPVFLGYHLCVGDTLPNGDRRKLVEGKTYDARRNGKKIKPRDVAACHPGLHASPTPWDALHAGGPDWATADHISFVLLRGVTDIKDQKVAGYTREHLVVRKLDINLRLRLAFLIGGAGINISPEEKRRRVNEFFRNILGNPELFPRP